jgi:hypothetical protein
MNKSRTSHVSIGMGLADVSYRSGPVPAVTQNISSHPPLVEEDITELPYAASAHLAPVEYDIGQIIQPHSLPFHNRPAPPPTFHDGLLLPRSTDEQDLADVSVIATDPTHLDTLQARPRSRKDGFGGEGWKDRMQQWTQAVPTDETYVQRLSGGTYADALG